MSNTQHKVMLVSLGCDKNLVDSEMMLGMISEAGFEITNDEQEAEVVIVNTCCFIMEAKEESITMRCQRRCCWQTAVCANGSTKVSCRRWPMPLRIIAPHPTMPPAPSMDASWPKPTVSSNLTPSSAAPCSTDWNTSQRWIKKDIMNEPYNTCTRNMAATATCDSGSTNRPMPNGSKPFGK